MSQSTPIRDLPKDNLRNPEEARIVQSIINENVEEYNRPPQYNDNVDDLVNDYPGQGRQMPPPQYEQFPDQNYPPQQFPSQQHIQHPQLMQPHPPQQQIPQTQFPRTQQQTAQAQAAALAAAREIGVPGSVLENPSLLPWLYREAKEPAIVALVYFLTSMNFIKMMLATYVPYLSNSFLNLLFRAILTGVLVYVARKFFIN